MKLGIGALKHCSNPFLISAAGFEDRSPRACELIADAGIALAGCLILTYEGSEHEASRTRMVAAARRIVSDAEAIWTAPTYDTDAICALLDTIPSEAHVVIDVTGVARHALLQLLSDVAARRDRFWLTYTEAEQYYPTQADLTSKLGDAWFEQDDLDEAFFKLAEYEEADLVYSANCSVSEVQAFPGRHLPNYPMLLIAFLAFKRSRLSAVLREYEASSRILIASTPVRGDLRWRKKAMELINFDLIEEFRKQVVSLDTLSWRGTRDYLSKLYEADNNNFRHNILLAPLGSKMQTVGAWAFARHHPEVKMITSTPTRHYPEKYSSGWRDTFLIDDLHD